MLSVRPVRLAMTATLTLASLVIVSQPWRTPAPIQKVAPEPVDTIVNAAEPSVPTVPTVSDARVSVVRDALAKAGTAPDIGEIPVVALVAYQRAATVATRVDESCGLSWTLLAAIGGVESDHGRYDGARLGQDGVSKPLIRGVELDGRGAVSKVADTDAGRVDGDKRWDRAVGPMQFLPSTWATLGVDADGDGIRSADDIDDAALGAAVFLCSAPGSLDTRQGMSVALHRYNPSAAYVAEVVALERQYRTGRYSQPDVPVTVRAMSPYTLAPSGPSQGDRNGQQGNGQGNSQGDGQGHQQGQHGDQPGQHGQQAGGTGHDGHAYEPDHPHGGGSHDPGGDPSDPPTTDPTDGPQTFPTDPPSTAPATEELAGTLQACGDETTPAWCVGDTVVDVGDTDYLAAAALADFDGDGTVETNAEELAGLEGTEVTFVVTAAKADEVPQVLAIGDEDYVEDGVGPTR